MSVFENLGEEKAKAMVDELIARGYSKDDAFGKVYSIECNMDNEDSNNSQKVNQRQKIYFIKN